VGADFMNTFIKMPVGKSHILILCLVFLAAGCVTQSGNSSRVKGEDVAVSNEVQSTFDQAIQLLEQEQYDTAITLLENVVEREQRLTAPYINLAMAYRQKGDEEKAEENLLMALAIDQAQPVANNELGILYRKQGKFEEAKKVYSNALAEHPDYLPVIKNLGILCDIYMRDPECALEQFEKYQQQAPGDKTIEIWIADLKTRM
jgi:Tfp pilus assembly protein PilF